jgi:hypothetical protein
LLLPLALQLLLLLLLLEVMASCTWLLIKLHIVPAVAC